MAEDQEERRKLSAFREKVLPTLVSAVVLALAGGLVALRDTVIQHDSDLRQVYVDGSNRSLRDAIQKIDSRQSELEDDVKAINKRIDKLVGY